MSRGEHIGDVVDVELAPTTAERLLVAATVPGRATVVGNEHVPTLGAPVRDPRHERDLPLIGGATVQPAQEAVARRVGTVEAGMHAASVGRSHLDELGLGERKFLPTAERPDGDNLALPGCVVVHHDLRRRTRPGSQRGEPSAVPRQLSVHTSGHLGDLSALEVDDAQAPETSFVAGESDAVPVG